MKDPVDTRFVRWRRFTVDFLIVAAAVGLAFAGNATDVVSVLVLSTVLVGLGMFIEPGFPAHAPTAMRAARARHALRAR